MTPESNEGIRIGSLNIYGINVGNFEDLVNECVEWKLDIIGVSETHMRGMTELSDREQKYEFVGKGRCEQIRKRGRDYEP